MKVTAFIGSARRKHTYHAVELFRQQLEAYGIITITVIRDGLNRTTIIR